MEKCPGLIADTYTKVNGNSDRAGGTEALYHHRQNKECLSGMYEGSSCHKR